MEFDTKFAIVVAEELMDWQKMNVVSFLSGSVTAHHASLIGDIYQDQSGQTYLPLCIQPVIVLQSNRSKLSAFIARANRQELKAAIFIEDMFRTGHDQANRQSVRQYRTEELPLVGIAIHGHKKLVDKVFKGAKLYR